MVLENEMILDSWIERYIIVTLPLVSYGKYIIFGLGSVTYFFKGENALGLRTKELDYVIGANIKHYRELSGFSQKNLADHLGISFQQIQKYENGIDRVSAVRLWEIATVFKKDIRIFYQKTKIFDWI